MLQSSIGWKGPLHPVQHPAEFKVRSRAWPPWVLNTQQFHRLSGTHIQRWFGFFPHISIRISLLQHKSLVHLWEEPGYFSLEPLINEVSHSPTAALSLPFSRRDHPRVLSLLTHRVPQLPRSVRDLLLDLLWLPYPSLAWESPEIFQTTILLRRINVMMETCVDTDIWELCWFA